jgi:23S rRNA (uridine2552-2'-O)-methyltransferase
MSSYEKPDFWSIKAQKEGYPARSVYKLKEIDEKFKLFKTAYSLKVLDLGAAPGSWSLYVLRTYANKPPTSRAPASTPAAFFLAAADLLPLSRQHDKGLFDRKDFFFIQGDFTTEPVRNELVQRGPYTALICDAAPNTTGTRTVDTLRSLALSEDALAFAKTCLAPGGNMALKVFQGGDTAALLKQMRECFNSVKSFKPACCRKDSFETYFIGLGKKDIMMA